LIGRFQSQNRGGYVPVRPDRTRPSGVEERQKSVPRSKLRHWLLLLLLLPINRDDAAAAAATSSSMFGDAAAAAQRSSDDEHQKRLHLREKWCVTLSFLSVFAVPICALPRPAAAAAARARGRAACYRTAALCGSRVGAMLAHQQRAAGLGEAARTAGLLRLLRLLRLLIRAQR
jgi:hypothetical protein